MLKTAQEEYGHMVLMGKHVYTLSGMLSVEIRDRGCFRGVYRNIFHSRGLCDRLGLKFSWKPYILLINEGGG